MADPESSTGYNGYGLYITIRHPDNSSSLYGHLSKETYEIAFIGKQVKRGDIIAKSGGAINDYPYAGGSTGPHLHLSYVKSGSLVDSNNNANKLNPIKCILGPSGPAGAPTFPAGAPTFPANP